jgi:hypothetical protein
MVLPVCTSQSPASGDGNLLGHHCKMQQKNGTESFRRLAKGSKNHFCLITADTGYQIFGSIKRTENNFLDYRQILEEEGGLFLGKLIFQALSV